MAGDLGAIVAVVDVVVGTMGEEIDGDVGVETGVEAAVVKFMLRFVPISLFVG